MDDQPPAFQFVTIDAARLRYLDQGSGTPVVLLHGNGSMIEDFVSSGIMEHASPERRFIAFDRPGFRTQRGRPRGRDWGPSQQASSAGALSALGIERPVMSATPGGTLVALAMALESACRCGGAGPDVGLLLPDTAHANRTPGAFPFTHAVLRHRLGPPMSGAL